MNDVLQQELGDRIAAYVGNHTKYMDADGVDLGKPPQEIFRALATQLYVLPDWMAELMMSTDIKFNVIKEDSHEERSQERGEFDALTGTLNIRSSGLSHETINLVFMHESCHAMDWILQQYHRKIADPKEALGQEGSFFSLCNEKWQEAVDQDLYDGDTFRAYLLQQKMNELGEAGRAEEMADCYKEHEPLLHFTKHLSPFYDEEEMPEHDEWKGYQHFEYPHEAFAEIMTYLIEEHYPKEIIRKNFPAMYEMMEKEILPELESMAHEAEAVDKAEPTETHNGLPLPWVERSGAELMREHYKGTQLGQ